MDSDKGILQQIRQAAARKILFLLHAVQQMSRPERLISAAEVRHVVAMAEIIEDYPEDPRGHSCYARSSLRLPAAGERQRSASTIVEAHTLSWESNASSRFSVLTLYISSTVRQKANAELCRWRV